MFGLGLDANAIGPLRVAADERPEDAPDEDESEEIRDEGVCLVGAAVQELEGVRELVVDLQQERRDEEDEEPEVCLLYTSPSPRD